MREILDKASLVGALNVQNSGDATLNGISINRATYNYADVAKFLVRSGVASGSPTSYTITCKIQDSADGSTWADVTDITSQVISADDTEVTLDVDAGKYRKFLRVVATILFVGGTSPAVDVAGVAVLSGKKEY